MIRVSTNLRKYRKISVITQEQLLVNIGRSYELIRRLEYKKEKIGCSVDTLYKISIVFGVTRDKLFE